MKIFEEFGPEQVVAEHEHKMKELKPVYRLHVKNLKQNVWFINNEIWETKTHIVCRHK